MKHHLASVLLAISLAATTPVAAQATARFAVTDNDGMEVLQPKMGPLKAAFEVASGLKVAVFQVSGRAVAVEAMAADQIDFGLTGPAEHVVFNARLDFHLHYFCAAPDRLALLWDFEVFTLLDRSHEKPGAWHWHLLAEHLG